MSYGHAQDYRKEGLFDDFLNAELDEMEAKRMASTLPAPIDVTPLEQRFEPQRRDFDDKLANLRQIDVRSIQANLIGNQYAELAATLDAAAKSFIEGAEAEFAPAIEKQRAALQATSDILNRIIEGPKQVRALCKPISATYQLRVNEKAEQERRELERKQREAAEAERQAEVKRLQEQAAAEQDTAERGRIEQEAQEVAAAPAIPVAIPASAVASPKPAGVSGTPIWIHKIVNWGLFCAALALMKPTITSDGNNTRIVLAGITIDISFTGLKKTKEAISGMAVSSGMEIRNRRQ